MDNKQRIKIIENNQIDANKRYNDGVITREQLDILNFQGDKRIKELKNGNE